MPVSAVSLPFREQAEFFRRKLNIPTQSWLDVFGEKNDVGFAVAGANRLAIVEDFHTSLQKARTLEEFRQDFDKIVAEHGWSYNGGRNWRSRIIYETNLNSSFMAGRFRQLLALRDVRPYWQYLHSPAVEEPRPEHLAWDGLILRWDDPWWQWHFPINGWGCECRVVALSESDLRRMGRTVDTAPPIEWEDRIIGQRSPGGPRTVRVPKGIDPGFAHTPGRSQLETFIPPGGGTGTPANLGVPGITGSTPADALPAARTVSLDRLLDAGIEPDRAIDLFLQEFGATLDTPALYRDILGEPLAIGRDLFYTGDGALKLVGQRPRHVLLLADTIQNPDEIWIAAEWHKELRKTVVRRRYIAQWQLAGTDQSMLAVFEIGNKVWEGVTTYSPRSKTYLDRRIRGVDGAVRVYRREE